MSSQPDAAAARRAQIIEAALACFSRTGYTNTTMDDIVAESGLSKGTLYWYFDSKYDLFAAAMMSVFETFGAQSLDTLAQCETATEKLHAVADEMIKLGTYAEGWFNLFVEFWTQSSRREEATQFWMGMLGEYQRAIVSIVEEGVRSGEFRPVDADALVWALMATYDGLAVYVTLAPEIDLERVSRTFVDTLVRGLQPAKKEDLIQQRRRT